MLFILEADAGQGRQRARQAAGNTAIAFAMVMGITHPADPHTIGVLPIGTDEQIVIPGKTHRGSQHRQR